MAPLTLAPGLCLAKTPSDLEPLTIAPRAWILPGSMLRLLVALLPTLLSAMRSRRHLVIENLALRQQLATLAVRRHPDIRPSDRVFWVLLCRYWNRWAQALAIVEPDTVVRWHRAGFRTYWNWLSRRGKRSGRPPLPREVRALIRRMGSENPWGAPRVHGELLRLGFDVSERSVSRYLRSLQRTPRANATWTTFLRNHRDGIAAMDFRHGRRDVVRYQSPWQNEVAERFVGTVRRELLDHVIVLNDRHLRQLIKSFLTYYNEDRTHIGVGKDSPCGRPVKQRPSQKANVVSLPRVGGLHHRYAWRQAA
jgi:hypothetical protein